MADENTPAEGAEDAATKAAAEKAAADEAAKEAETKAAEAEAEEDDLLKGAKNPDAVRNAIKAERERARAAKDDAKAKADEADKLRAKVQEFEDRDKSEQEKAEKRAKDAEEKATKAEHKLLRLEVAAAKKVPSNLASRLVGENKAELEADADELLKSVKADDTVKLDGGARRTVKSGADMNQRIREMAGRG
jgi:colicin import membrane protein